MIEIVRDAFRYYISLRMKYITSWRFRTAVKSIVLVKLIMSFLFIRTVLAGWSWTRGSGQLITNIPNIGHTKRFSSTISTSDPEEVVGDILLDPDAIDSRAALRESTSRHKRGTRTQIQRCVHYHDRNASVKARSKRLSCELAVHTTGSHSQESGGSQETMKQMEKDIENEMVSEDMN